MNLVLIFSVFIILLIQCSLASKKRCAHFQLKRREIGFRVSPMNQAKSQLVSLFVRYFEARLNYYLQSSEPENRGLVEAVKPTVKTHIESFIDSQTAQFSSLQLLYTMP